METDKPLISILMAVYEPRLDWLEEQLLSLNQQTYPNLRLWIRDDGSPTVPFQEIVALVQRCVTAFPYTIEQNEQNLGSNATFERLTQEAEGEYFAYCDQDDVWLPEKLTILQRELERTGAQLVCSDMYIIDGAGNTVADSITKIRRRHVFRSGEGLTKTLWRSNFASGCALLVRTETAKQAIPFNPYMYYDHYITLYSANLGSILSLEEPLLQHREHGENQSSTLQGVLDRETYLEKRVDEFARAIQWLLAYFPADAALREQLQEGALWVEARQNYLRGERKQAKVIWKYRRFSPKACFFELLLPYLPKTCFSLAVWASRKNYI